VTPETLVAVDLGASGGRVMAGTVVEDRLQVDEISRFPNRVVKVNSCLHWDILGLWQAVVDGLVDVARSRRVRSIGIDSWAVDYGLLDVGGELLGNPVHYRDRRTEGVATRVEEIVGPAELYRRTGVAALPFNTIYQLAAASTTPAFGLADKLLLIPDLLAFWMTGEEGAELTNASTTGLLGASSGTWDFELVERLRISRQLFPPLRLPGSRIGSLTDEMTELTGIAPDVEVTAVASHDTASAIVAVPASGQHWAYLSCGTWSLLGLELDTPVLSEQARQSGFTNERGVDGTIRFLRNVTGLWLLQESIRTWATSGIVVDQEALFTEAARVAPLESVIDVNDPSLIAPGDLPSRIRRLCSANGQRVPQTLPEVVRCILDSLALAHAQTLHTAEALSGRHVDVLHIVGGGARNRLLCQLTADACAVEVRAGPVEATTAGNLLVQASGVGIVGAGIDEMRAVSRRSHTVNHYTPRPSAQWDSAHNRLALLTPISR